jgi:CBS domain containing-hemolysin-like protein
MTAMVLLIEVVLLLGLALLTGILVVANTAVEHISRGRARRLAESERPGAASLEVLVDHPGRIAGALAVMRAVAYAGGSASFTWVALADGLVEADWFGLLLGAAVAVLVILIVGETLARTLAVHNPERVALAAAGAARWLTAALYPIARAFAAPWIWLAGLVAPEPVPDAWLTADEIRAAGSADDDEVSRDEAEEAIMDAVADFTQKIVREVMVPRTDMVCVEDTATVAEALDLIEESGVSRVPVFPDTLDHIRGVLYAKDLLLCIGRDGCADGQFASIAREPYFVPETKPVEELLIEMRTRTHIAIVADEYGGTAGLVTIEDLLEEIVGEIFDEYDTAMPLMIDLGDGRARIDARMPIDDLNEVFGTDIELEADSVGGLFVELAGHIPTPGEALVVEGLRLVVEDMEGNRVRGLLVEPAATHEEGKHE